MDTTALREEFPITRNYNFLNHASVAPIPKRAAEAMTQYLTQQQEGSYVKARYGRQVAHARRTAAELIGAKPDEVAFTKSTSEGICFVANGLKWNAGDNIVTTAVEFPSNMYPWMNLQSRGVQLRTIMEENGRIPIDNLIDAIDSHTRVVAVSAVQFSSGYRMDLHDLGEWCQKRGVLFCVDAIQTLGVLPINVREMHIDFLSAGGHKWLCGPEGTGIFFCDRELAGHLRPTTLGWRSMKNGEDFSHYNYEFHDDARRFEASAHNVAGIVGLGASMDLLIEVGIEQITEHVLSLTDHLVERVRERGYRIFSSRADGEKSGIVSIASPSVDLPQLQQHLENEHRIITIIRDGRLRISPHLYNTVEEIDRLVDAMPKHA
jgi:selenocysteine lyase/cysteine desulfurase